MSRVSKLFLTTVLDLTLAAGIVGGDYYYNYRMPHRLPQSGMTVYAEGKSAPAAASAVSSSSAESSAAAASAVASVSSSDSASTGSSAVAGSWKDRFSSFFTDQVKSTDMSYSSPDIAVFIEKKSYGKGAEAVTYYIADIHIANINCLNTEFAKDTYGVGYYDGIENMSQNVNAILAINGDSYSNDKHKNSGTVIRNGIVYRTDPTQYDVCALYQDGTMKTYGRGEFDPQQAVKDKVLQTWIFGPSLLDANGNIPQSYNTWDYIRETHPRSAIGYYEPGHYCMVLVDGRQTDTGYSRGMTLKELSAVFYGLGCKAAYNLDGGHSSFLTFKGRIASHPYKPGKQISDCIYIAEPQKGTA